MAQAPRPDAARVQVSLEQLRQLVGDTEAFTSALVDNVWWFASAADEAGGTALHDINADEHATAAAFRQEDVVWHSLKAARRALQTVEKDLARPAVGVSEPLWQTHVERYVLEMQRREDLFKAVLAGVSARDDGIIPASPNPRRRAEHMIAQRNLAEDIPRGEIVRVTAQLRRRKR